MQAETRVDLFRLVPNRATSRIDLTELHIIIVYKSCPITGLAYLEHSKISKCCMKYIFFKLNFNFFSISGSLGFMVLAPSTINLGLWHLIGKSILLIVEPNISSLSESGPRLLDFVVLKWPLFFRVLDQKCAAGSRELKFSVFYLYLQSLQVRLISVKSEAVGFKISLLCFHSLLSELH